MNCQAKPRAPKSRISATTKTTAAIKAMAARFRREKVTFSVGLSDMPRIIAKRRTNGIETKGTNERSTWLIAAICAYEMLQIPASQAFGVNTR